MWKCVSKLMGKIVLKIIPLNPSILNSNLVTLYEQKFFQSNHLQFYFFLTFINKKSTSVKIL